jgi:DNA polymerase-3 subunit gamma/tau
LETLSVKYRPKHLLEFVGQEKIIQELKNRFHQRTISSSTLLVGPTGTGKTTLANLISQHLLCESLDKFGNPCGRCPSCLTVENEEFSDFYFRFNASNINTEEARNITENAQTKAFTKTGIKVFQVEEFQELAQKNKEAALNLLPIIENPPKHVYFIFNAMVLKNIPPALMDRCIVYFLKPHKKEVIFEQLGKICEKEKIDINTTEKAQVLLTIAENASGSLRKAISYLERVIYSNLWNEEELIEELNILPSKTLNDFINSLFTGNFKVLSREMDREIVNTIRYRLLLILKGLHGIELDTWQAEQVKGIIKVPYNQIREALSTLNKIHKYFYQDAILIESFLLKIMRESNSIIEATQLKKDNPYSVTLAQAASEEQMQKSQSVREKAKK